MQTRGKTQKLTEAEVLRLTAVAQLADSQGHEQTLSLFDEMVMVYNASDYFKELTPQTKLDDLCAQNELRRFFTRMAIIDHHEKQLRNHE